MKTLRTMVIAGWLLVAIIEVILYYAGKQQEYPIIRQDRMATFPILIFLTIYYIFRIYQKGKE